MPTKGIMAIYEPSRMPQSYRRFLFGCWSMSPRFAPFSLPGPVNYIIYFSSLAFLSTRIKVNEFGAVFSIPRRLLLVAR